MLPLDYLSCPGGSRLAANRYVIAASLSLIGFFLGFRSAQMTSFLQVPSEPLILQIPSEPLLESDTAQAKFDRLQFDLLRWNSLGLEAVTTPDDLAERNQSPAASSSYSEEIWGLRPLSLEAIQADEVPPSSSVSLVVSKTPKRSRKKNYQLPASTRQKNGAAQQRFRQRQKERQQDMAVELEGLREQNARLQNQVASLEERIAVLTDQRRSQPLTL